MTNAGHIAVPVFSLASLSPLSLQLSFNDIYTSIGYPVILFFSATKLS